MTPRARDAAGPLFLVAAIPLPYHPLTTMRSIVVTDDRIVSDIFHAELPGRVELARLLGQGELPVWTPRLCAGFPMIAGGFPDPLTLLTFGLLPTRVAVNVFMLLTLIIAALGTYALSRRLGATRLGATLAGLSFSWSGYMVCQLKHLGIVATVCWLPVGLLLLDRALTTDRDLAPAQRLRALVPFALLVALQWVSNFPQSAYICSVCYGGFALWSAAAHVRRSWARATTLLLAVGAASALGVVCAAIALLPMRELAATSDRRQGVTFEFATMLPYAPRDIITFLIPYAHGDVSDRTYVGTGLFWESYGYVGLLTTLLALFSLARIRRRHVAFLAIATVFSYLVVLGPATPVFKVLFHALPGMNSFRFPTRWLVVVDLGLAVLGGLGLSHLQELLRARARRAWPVAAAVVALTTADLVFHQRRQNAFADARTWLAPPATATFLRAQPGRFRIYSPMHYATHSVAFGEARGWADLAPYYRHRDLIQPNTNVLWGLDTCDCYAGLSPETTSIVWSELGLVNSLATSRHGMIHIERALLKLLAVNAVRYVLLPRAADAPELREVFRAGDARVYEIPMLPRAFLVPNAVRAADLNDAIHRTMASSFDPFRTVVIEGEPGAQQASTLDARATFVSERATSIELETVSDAPAWLVLADQWYPGWTARLDGAPVDLVRANGRHRALRVPAGTHRVRFDYRSASLARGAWISLAGLLALVGVYLACLRATLARDVRPRAAG